MSRTVDEAGVAPTARRAVIMLFLGAFVMGSSELLVVGVLDLVADDLVTSVPTAGWLVTGYALGLAAGGPALTALTTRLRRRSVLLATMPLALASNLTATLTTSYELMLVARVATGALQGLFLAVAFAIAVSVCAPQKTGWAIGLVISGVAVSAAVGVPLGTLAGHLLGWRGSYGAITALLAITLLATAMLVPNVSPGNGSAGSCDSTGSVAGQARYAFAPRVLALLGLCALVFGAAYAALTYIVPFLHQVTGIDGTLASGFMLVYGVASAIGSFGGGRFADRDAGRTLILGSIATAASLTALWLLGANPVLVAVVLAGLGMSAMGMGPSLQYRVNALAGPGAPLAQSLPASAINLGIAAGSLAGGVAIDGFGAAAAILAGLAFALAAIPAALWTRRLTAPDTDQAGREHDTEHARASRPA